MTRRQPPHSPPKPPIEAASSCPRNSKEKTVTDSIVSDLVALLDEDLREAYEERAAIMNFDGGVDRELAEALALLQVIARYPDRFVAALDVSPTAG